MLSLAPATLAFSAAPIVSRSAARAVDVQMGVGLVYSTTTGKCSTIRP